MLVLFNAYCMQLRDRPRLYKRNIEVRMRTHCCRGTAEVFNTVSACL